MARIGNDLIKWSLIVLSCFSFPGAKFDLKSADADTAKSAFAKKLNTISQQASSFVEGTFCGVYLKNVNTSRADKVPCALPTLTNLDFVIHVAKLLAS